MAGKNIGKKSTYKVKNWSQYNESLVRRGDITFWFSDDVVRQWSHENAEKKNGRPFTYSDTAIETLLVLRELFRLPYRQTEGLARSLAKLMNADVPIPDFTLLAKRAAKHKVSLDIDKRTGAIDVVVDSTGLKVYGEGEWKARTHGKSRRRTWRKLHLTVDPDSQDIVAEVLTENSGHDSQQVQPMLDQVEADVDSLSGDGGYDTWNVYGLLERRGIRAVISPQKNAKIQRHGNTAGEPLARDEAIREIREKGRKRWKMEIGYHRRSLAETAMYRVKNAFGSVLKNRTLENQQTEARLRCKILNHFNRLGLPIFEWS